MNKQPFRSPLPVQILGTGHALPGLAVSSAALDERLRLPARTVEQTCGVRVRHFATEKETAAALGARAACQALALAGLSLFDIDALVACSATMDQGMPCNAALIHAELGLSATGVPAFDINASCLGFIAALDALAWPLAGGRYRCILVVAADLASCGLDWSDVRCSGIFGDGAGAAVLGWAPEQGSRLLASALQTYSVGASFCEIPAGGSRHHPQRVGMDAFAERNLFRMNGKGVFRLAAKHLPDFVDRLLEQASVTKSDLDWIVPHQASHLAMSHLSERLGFEPSRIINIFADHGNQVAASVPTALDIAVRDGRIRRGHRVLLLGTGAGLSLGGAVLEY